MTVMYTDAEAIAAYLGVTFTPEQAAQAAALAAAATSFVDTYTQRTWQTVSPVTGEVLPVVPSGTPGSGLVYLLHKPAASISSVSLRSAYPNADVELQDVSTYELLDPQNGVLTVAGVWWPSAARWPGYSILAVVDYAYADEAPADIQLAATMIAAGQMSQMLAIQRGSQVIADNPSLAGLESIAVGQNDVSVKLGSTVTGSAAAKASADGSSWAAPGSAVAGLLDPYRRVVIA